MIVVVSVPAMRELCQAFELAIPTSRQCYANQICGIKMGKRFFAALRMTGKQVVILSAAKNLLRV
jgi:hypothetical protein